MRDTSQTTFQSTALPSSLSAEKKDQLESFFQTLTSQGISIRELQSYLEQRGKTPSIPITVFAHNQLAPLQALVKYLKENLGYANHTIARLLGRSQKTIWQTYSDSLRVVKEPLTYGSAKISIPFSIFVPSKLTIFEQLIIYLKDQLGYTYHSVGLLINRNERTIWTVYRRALKKGDQQ